MKIFDDLKDITSACRESAASGSLGFVPTMGAIHEGHLSLVHQAQKHCDTVAVSIFVNPLQFGPDEDLKAYPQPLKNDTSLLKDAGVDLLLVLSSEEMYPEGFTTRVVQGDAMKILEGASREGHFEGVLTVVAKMFSIVRPHQAYFGQKDFQQSVLIRRMTSDLNLETEIVQCDTVRESDGLALSSRNTYLGEEDRRKALGLVGSLIAAEQCFQAGERSANRLEQTLRTAFAEEPGVAVDYARIVDDGLRFPQEIHEGHVAVVAAWIGSTRLIDNHRLGDPLGPFTTNKASGT